MVWGKNRSSRSRGSRSNRRPPRECTEQNIAYDIHQSVVRLRVALQLESIHDDEKPLCDLVKTFEQHFDACRNLAVTSFPTVRVELLECGLNTWQNLVELQRVLMRLKRPMERGEEQRLVATTTLRRAIKSNEWTLSLSIVEASVETLWKFASSVMLKLKSCGVPSKVLLPTHRVLVLLSSAVGELEESTMDEFRWKGEQVASELVVRLCGKESLEIQRIVLPPIRNVTRTELQYPELVSILEGMLSNEANIKRPVVIILRGIPGSGKSTLRQELEAICRARRIAFTACSADFYFETSRGYKFDVKQLEAAHGACRQDFSKALQSDVLQQHDHPFHNHVVLVDNTHTHRWEYEKYEAIAKSHGSRVEIIEIKCADVSMALQMGQRNSHGASTDKVISMFMRWEKDLRARCFTPHFEPRQLTENPLTNEEVGKVRYVGLFLDDTAQKKLLAKIPLAHPCKFVDHVTLFYQPNILYTRGAELGAAYTIRGVEIVQDEWAQALRVELDKQLSLPVRNEIPHITMSAKDGVSASYSNDLLVSKSAKRIILDPPIDLTVRLGAAVLVRNQRVVTKSSPFVGDAQYCPKKAFETKNSCINREEMPDNCVFVQSKVFAVYVDESDLMRDFDKITTSLLWMIQIVHHKGSHCNTHRLLCIQKSQVSSSTPVAAILKSIQDCVCISSALQFDNVIVLSQAPSYHRFGLAIHEHVSTACLSTVNELTLITSVEASMRWPFSTIESLRDAAINVIYSDLQGSAMQSIPAYRTVLSTLDLLGITTQEEVRSITFRGVNAVKEAWALVYGADDSQAVQRIDTTIVGLHSSVVELLISLPSSETLSEVEVLRTKLLSALEGMQSLHLVRSCSSNHFYLSLCGASSDSPVFCVLMESEQMRSEKNSITNARRQLNFCEYQLKMSRVICGFEAYSVLVCLLRAIIVRRCGDELPSECRLSSLVTLTSERLVERYLNNTDRVGELPSADNVISGRILLNLHNVLLYLSKLEPEEWTAAFGDSLLELQGNKMAQLIWRKAMGTAMQSCAGIVNSNCCITDSLRYKTQLTPQQIFHAVIALIKTERTAARGSLMRTFIEVHTHSVCSHLHSLAFCDELRLAAAMVEPHVNEHTPDNLHTTDNSNFFVCATTLVTRRVDVATSSLELLGNVVKKLRALDSVFGHDYEVHVGE